MPCDTYLITVSLTSTITQLMQIKLQSIDWVTVIFLIAQPTQLACTPFGNFRLAHKNCNISFCAEERFPLFLSAVKSWKGRAFSGGNDSTKWQNVFFLIHLIFFVNKGDHVLLLLTTKTACSYVLCMLNRLLNVFTVIKMHK